MRSIQGVVVGEVEQEFQAIKSVLKNTDKVDFMVLAGMQLQRLAQNVYVSIPDNGIKNELVCFPDTKVEENPYMLKCTMTPKECTTFLKLNQLSIQPSEDEEQYVLVNQNKEKMYGTILFDTSALKDFFVSL